MTSTGNRALTAEHLMRTDVFTVAATTPLRELGQQLSDYGMSGAPVTDEAGHIIGVVSIRDLVDRFAEVETLRKRTTHDFYAMHVGDEELPVGVVVPDDAEDTVADIMTAQVHSVGRETPLGDVARTMRELRVHRILVQDGGKYVGMLSTFDLLQALETA